MCTYGGKPQQTPGRKLIKTNDFNRAEDWNVTMYITSHQSENGTIYITSHQSENVTIYITSQYTSHRTNQKTLQYTSHRNIHHIAPVRKRYNIQHIAIYIASHQWGSSAWRRIPISKTRAAVPRWATSKHNSRVVWKTRFRDRAKIETYILCISFRTYCVENVAEKTAACVGQHVEGIHFIVTVPFMTAIDEAPT